MAMVAVQNIEPKTVVMSCPPYSYVPYEPRKQFVCAYCIKYFKPLEDRWKVQQEALYSQVQTGLDNLDISSQENVGATHVIIEDVGEDVNNNQAEETIPNVPNGQPESNSHECGEEHGECDIDALIPCPYCVKVWYCSQECMELDAVEHLRYECVSLQNFDIEWAKEYYQYCDDLITDVRLLLKTMNRRMVQLESGSNEFEEEYELLISNMDCYTEDILLTLRGVVQYANYLVPDEVFMDEDELLAIYCKHRVNMFGLWAPTEECLGYGVYPRASYFNHSCWPNTTFYKNEESKFPHMDFITALPIEEGEEVCISYIDISAGLMARRQTLLDKYFFHCTCQRCQYQEEYPEEKDPYYIYWAVSPEEAAQNENQEQTENTEQAELDENFDFRTTPFEHHETTTPEVADDA